MAKVSDEGDPLPLEDGDLANLADDDVLRIKLQPHVIQRDLPEMPRYARPGPLRYSVGSTILANGPEPVFVDILQRAGLECAFEINPSLPTGLALDPCTGEISGTPEAEEDSWANLEMEPD